MDAKTARNGREAGQALVLFVLAFAVLMGFVALTIDVGLIFVEKRSMQNAADAAALAAVAELPDSPSGAITTGEDFASRNGYSVPEGATVTVRTPYNGNAAAVEVVVEKDVPFLFARVLGMEQAHVVARAVAAREHDLNHGPAIFAQSSGCGNPTELQVSGADIDVVGDLISNGDVKISTSDIYADGNLTYVCDGPLVQNGTFTDGLNQVADLQDWPVYYTGADFACDYTFNSTDVWQIRPSSAPGLYLDPVAGILRPGVYCSDGDIVLSGGATGNVTFVSRAAVYVKGGPYNLKAYENDALIYAEASGTAIHISANGFTWEGIIFAPFGSIQFSTAKTNSSSGGIYGYSVKVSTSSISITGLPDDVLVFSPPRLVE